MPIFKVTVIGLFSASSRGLTTSSVLLELLALLTELACLLLCARDKKLLADVFIEVLVNDSKLAFDRAHFLNFSVLTLIRAVWDLFAIKGSLVLGSCFL